MILELYDGLGMSTETVSPCLNKYRGEIIPSHFIHQCFQKGASMECGFTALKMKLVADERLNSQSLYLKPKQGAGRLQEVL